MLVRSLLFLSIVCGDKIYQTTKTITTLLIQKGRVDSQNSRKIIMAGQVQKQKKKHSLSLSKEREKFSTERNKTKYAKSPFETYM